MATTQNIGQLIVNRAKQLDPTYTHDDGFNDLGEALHIVLNHIDTVTAGIVFYEVHYHNGKFYYEDTELTYNDLVEKFNDDLFFLYLKYANLIYIPSIGTNDAIAFSVAWTRRETVGDVEYAQPYISRIIVNSDNVSHSEQTGLQSLELMLDDFSIYDEQYGNKMYPTATAVKQYIDSRDTIHVINVNATTAVGTWRYQFQIMAPKNATYTQLFQIASYLYQNKPNIRIPATGTYTTNGTLYHVESVAAINANQVKIEMFKATDGSETSIETGAVDIIDTIYE